MIINLCRTQGEEERQDFMGYYHNRALDEEHAFQKINHSFPWFLHLTGQENQRDRKRSTNPHWQVVSDRLGWE